MILKEAKITFPLEFFETLVGRSLTAQQITRNYTATFVKNAQAKPSCCEIVTTVTDKSVEIYLKSFSIQCKHGGFFCNIETCSENIVKSRKNNKKGCRRSHKIRKSVSDNNLDHRDDEIVKSSCNNTISYYIKKTSSPKRKLCYLGDHTESIKKLKLSQYLQNTSENFTSGSDDGRAQDNKFKTKATSDLEVDCTKDSQYQNGHDIAELHSASSENEVLEKIKEDKNIHQNSNNCYISINSVFENVDVKQLTVMTSDVPFPLKAVSLGSIDLKVSIEKSLINHNQDVVVCEEKNMRSKCSKLENQDSAQSTSDTVSKYSTTKSKSSNEAVQPNSALFVEEADIPLFYIHSNEMITDEGLFLGPFVLGTTPFPHLRWQKDGQYYCYRFSKNRNWRDQSEKFVDLEKGKDDEMSHLPTPSRKQPQRSTSVQSPTKGYSKSATSVRGRHQSPDMRNVKSATSREGHESKVDSWTSQKMSPVFDSGMASSSAGEDGEKDTSEKTDGVSGTGIDDGGVSVKKTVPIKTKKKKKTILKKHANKSSEEAIFLDDMMNTPTFSDVINSSSNMSKFQNKKVGNPDKVKHGREVTRKSKSAVGKHDTDDIKLVNQDDGTTVSEAPIKKSNVGKPKHKKKKAALSKKGGMEAMYKRMSSYCIRIIPETGSDLWEPVSDLSLVVSTCKYCPNSSKSFPDPLILADHIRNIHKREAHYMETVRECRAKMKLKCNLCVEDRFYSRWESFGMHMRDVHSDKCDEVINLLKCSICSRTWVNRNKFDRHMETVHGNAERFLCHYCPQTFKWESSLRCHIKGIHDKETAHVCEICGAVFSRKEYVRVHMQKYHNEKSPGKPRRSRGIHCPICDLRLEKKKDITSHMIEVHQLEASHVKCKICKSKFASEEGLVKHTTDFHGSKQYQHCPYCGSGFQARDNMLRHIAKDHLKIPPPKCPLCEKQFDYNTDLRFHLRKEHGYGDNDHTYGQADSLKSIAILKCEYCDKPFFWVMGLINHIVVFHVDQFPYECRECGQRFKEGSSLQHHIAFRHIKASQCEEVRTLDTSVGASSQKNVEADKSRIAGKDKNELQTSNSSVNQEEARKVKAATGDPKAKSDKNVPAKAKVPVLKTPGGLTFQAPPDSIQIPIPDIHGSFTSGHPLTKKTSSVQSTVDRWNYPTGHWSLPPIQHHHAIPQRDYINQDPMTRTDEPVYHVLDYVRESSNCHPDPAAVRPVHQLTAVQADHVHLCPAEHATLQPEHSVGDRGDGHGVGHHVNERGLIHPSSVHTGDRTVVHTSVVPSGDRAMINAQAVNNSGEGGASQLITAENLIGLLHEFNSQQQQTNQYFNPQFF